MEDIGSHFEKAKSACVLLEDLHETVYGELPYAAEAEAVERDPVREHNTLQQVRTRSGGCRKELCWAHVAHRKVF